eukprot:TRINITY_DN7678_c0_g3_i22.p1 TRINITY_DN7678_c0_g3~~TRINITY_DN7678_c0_g3_i22.p1  ORF type:complete len:104 (+),score=23.49 TRINITY_DN7678_c0_g3_i22:56-367(+)
MYSTLASKVVFVSGGTRGIGLCIAQKMAAEGASIIVSGRNADTANNVASNLPVVQESQRHHAVSCDLNSSATSISESANDAVQKFGKVDVLVNCAGDDLFLFL